MEYIRFGLLGLGLVFALCRGRRYVCLPLSFLPCAFSSHSACPAKRKNLAPGCDCVCEGWDEPPDFDFSPGVLQNFSAFFTVLVVLVRVF